MGFSPGFNWFSMAFVGFLMVTKGKTHVTTSLASAPQELDAQVAKATKARQDERAAYEKSRDTNHAVRRAQVLVRSGGGGGECFFFFFKVLGFIFSLLKETIAGT